MGGAMSEQDSKTLKKVRKFVADAIKYETGELGKIRVSIAKCPDERQELYDHAEYCKNAISVLKMVELELGVDNYEPVSEYENVKLLKERDKAVLQVEHLEHVVKYLENKLGK